MPDFLITYDLHATDEARRAFIKEALDELMTYVWQGLPDKTLFRLPSTTLWTEAATAATVERRLDDTISKVKARFPDSIDLEKFFICEFASPFVGSDEVKQPEPAWEHGRALATCMSHQNSDPFFAY